VAERVEYPPPYIELAFGDGKYLFKLGLAQIGELQTKTGIGIGGLYARVLRGRYPIVEGEPATLGMPEEADWYLDDLLQTIRLALIGGGGGTVDEQPVTVDPTRASQLLAAYVFPARPLNEAWNYAAAILTALIIGFDDGSREPDDGNEKKK
jgi:Phage tail tube protein, GTA-gp10